TRSAENRDDQRLVHGVHAGADGGDQLEPLLRSRELGGDQQIDAIGRGSMGRASGRLDEAVRLGRRRAAIRDDCREDVEVMVAGEGLYGLAGTLVAFAAGPPGAASGAENRQL